MEIKDFITLGISVLALGISAYNLWVGHNMSKFNRKAKGADLRTAMLTQLAEVGSNLTEANEIRLRLLRASEEHSNFTLYKQVLEMGYVDDLTKKLAESRQLLVKVPIERGLDMYAQTQAEIDGMRDGTAGVLKTLKGIEARILKASV